MKWSEWSEVIKDVGADDIFTTQWCMDGLESEVRLAGTPDISYLSHNLIKLKVELQCLFKVINCKNEFNCKIVLTTVLGCFTGEWEL